MKKILALFIVGMFCISFASAFQFDNIKSFDSKIGNYGKVTIKDNFGFQDLAELELKKNTDTCGLSCNAETEIVMHQKGSLIDDVRFMTLIGEDEWKEQDIRSYQFYIKTNEEEYSVDDYEYICTETGKLNVNGTAEISCENKLVGSHTEKKPLWEKYTLGTEVDAGTYEIKLEGEKKPSRTVDWQITSQGKLIDEWAVWGNISDGDDAEVTLNSPEDNYISSIFSVDFNCSAEVTGTSLTNISLWHNGTGTWERNQTNEVTNEVIKDYGGSGGAAQSSKTSKVGARILVKENTELHEVYLDSSHTATKCYLQEEDGTQLTSVSVSTRTCDFGGYSLTADTTYRITGDAEGSSFTMGGTSDGIATMPYDSDVFNWTGGYDNDGNLNTNVVFMVENITIIGGGFTSGEEIFTTTITDPTLWTCEACDTDGDCGFASENRTVSVDSTAPVVTINKPTTTLDYGYINKSEILNWSIVEAGTLDSVWYNYNGTNVTSGGVENQTNFTIESYSNSNLTVYANDSATNLGSDFIDWDYKLFQNAESYSASTTEGATENYYLNVTLLSGLQPSTVNLIYNGTGFNSSYPATITNTAGTNYTFTRTIEIPSVGATTNNTLFWEITLDDATKINTSFNLQEVVGMGVDNCSTYANKLYNFTLVDERTQNAFDYGVYNASGKLNLQLYTLDRGTLIENLSYVQEDSGSYQVCVSTDLSGNSAFSLDLQLQYDADSYAQEFYHIQNATINSNSLGTNITLYDLEDSKDQEFVIAYKSSSFLPVEDALIIIQRKYVDEGLFKTVEIPITDVDGETIAHLELADAIYTFIVTKNGEVLGTFENVLAVCQDIVLGNCDINLNSVISDTSTEDFTSFDDLTITLTYNQTSRELRSIFVVPSGNVKTFTLNATLFDNLGETQVCSDSLSSSSGTLSCTIPTSFGNGTVMAVVSENGIPRSSALINMAQDNRDIFGTSVIFLTMFLFMTLVGVGISDNPMITGVFLLVGVLLSIGLNLVNTSSYYGAGATMLWVFIAIIMILIKGAKRA